MLPKEPVSRPENDHDWDMTVATEGSYNLPASVICGLNLDDSCVLDPTTRPDILSSEEKNVFSFEEILPLPDWNGVESLGREVLASGIERRDRAIAQHDQLSSGDDWEFDDWIDFGSRP